MKLLLVGPVNFQQVPISAPGATNVNIACSTVTMPPGCAARADALGAQKLVAIPGIGTDEVLLVAFSEGGSMAKRLALNSLDRAQIRVMQLADATYSDWGADGKPVPPEGFVLYAIDALVGGKLLVATASSSPNRDLPNGSQTLEAIKSEIEKRTGQRFAEGGELPGVSPQPVRLWRLGNVWLADYQLTVPHGDHANKLAKQVWNGIVLPWLGTGSLPEPTPEPSHTVPDEVDRIVSYSHWGALAVGAGLGYLSVRAWRKRS